MTCYPNVPNHPLSIVSPLPNHLLSSCCQVKQTNGANTGVSDIILLA